MTPGSPVSEPGGSPLASPWLRSPKIPASGRSEIAAAARFSDILREEMVETQTLKRTEKKGLHLIQVFTSLSRRSSIQIDSEILKLG